MEEKKRQLRLNADLSGLDNVFVFLEEHLAKGCEAQIEICSYESAQFDLVWEEWTSSGHEYGIRDAEFLEKGLKEILNFVMLVIKKKN